MPITNHPESEEKLESKGKSNFFTSQHKEDKEEKSDKLARISKRQYRTKDTYKPKSSESKLEEVVQSTKDGKLEEDAQPMQLATIPFDITKNSKKRFSTPIQPSGKVTATSSKEFGPILPPLYPISTTSMMERLANVEEMQRVKRRKIEDSVTLTFAAIVDKFYNLNQLVLKPRSSDFRGAYDNYGEIIDNIRLYPLNNSERTADFIERARRKLGAVSLNQTGKYHIFTNTKMARDAVKIFLEAFYGREESTKTLKDYNKKREKLQVDSCFSGALVKLKYKEQDYYYCLLSVSSLGKDMHNESGLWDLLVATANDLNNAILSGKKRGSKVDETLFQVLDMSSRELNDIIGRITKKLVDVDKKYNSHANCSEKPYIAELLKIFYTLGTEASIEGVVNLNFRKESTGKYLPLNAIVIGDHHLREKGLCFNCQDNRLTYLQLLLEAATQGPKLSFPSPMRSYGSNYKTVSLLEALVEAIYQDKHSVETSEEVKEVVKESISCHKEGNKKFEMELGAAYNEEEPEEGEIVEVNIGGFGR